MTDTKEITQRLTGCRTFSTLQATTTGLIGAKGSSLTDQEQGHDY